MIAVQWHGNSPEFYVAEVTRAQLHDSLAPGDILVNYQGVDSSRFLETFHRESNGNHWRSIGDDIADYLSWQSRARRGTVPGAVAQWTFKKRQSGQVVTVQSAWEQVADAPTMTDFAVQYPADLCGGHAERDYGAGYAVRQSGTNYCVYTSSGAIGRRYPVVRQFSFAYSGRDAFRALVADHHNLKLFLEGCRDAQGVILDLRDNLGGNNPNWFLDWWAPSAYSDMFVFSRLHADFNSVDKLREAGITGWGPASRTWTPSPASRRESISWIPGRSSARRRTAGAGTISTGPATR